MKEDDFVLSSPKNLCQQCHVEPSKYTCPQCEIRTCSLVCVKSHKNDFNCNGIRDKVAYVPMEDFADINLLNDYRYLEDVARVSECSKRDIIMKQHRKPPFLQYLTREAYKRNIRFRAMPYPMHRRKNNSSIYHKKTDSILWDITWIFSQLGILHTEKRISENLLISEAFQKVFHPSIAHPILLHKLKAYRNAGVENLFFYMKQEFTSVEKPMYYNLCAQQSLKSNLAGKIVVEHPTIHVLFPEEISKYSLINESRNSSTKEIKDKQSEVNEEESEKAKEEEEEEREESPDEIPIIKTDISITTANS